MKVLVEFDTKAKTLTVKKDGAEVPNVVAVELARSDYYGYGYSDDEESDEFRFSLTQMKADKDNDTKEMIRLVASENDQLVSVPIPTQEKEGREDLRATAQLRRISSKATADIAEFFKEGF